MSRREQRFGGGSELPAAGVEERSDEAPAAGAAPAGAVPDPEVLARPTRRQFTAEYRLSLRVVQEQYRNLALMQTNREHLGDHWREVVVPMPVEPESKAALSEPVKSYFDGILEARSSYDVASRSSCRGVWYAAIVVDMWSKSPS